MIPDPFKFTVLLFGIALTAVLLFGDPWMDSRLQMALALLWVGVGGTLVLLSRERERSAIGDGRD